MEKAFLKALYHLLPHQYRYVIVADRGFGNSRFMKDSIETGYEYIVRTQANWKIEIKGHQTKLQFLPKENTDCKNVELITSKIKTHLVMSFKDKKNEGWYIFSSLNDALYKELVFYYKDRFSSEMMFKDEKSQGFDIEGSKINDKSRFKRLLFMIYVAQAIMMILGKYIFENEDEELKKML